MIAIEHKTGTLMIDPESIFAYDVITKSGDELANIQIYTISDTISLFFEYDSASYKNANKILESIEN